MGTIVENLGAELERLDKEYADYFAGQSRLTRDLDQLDRMIASVAGVVAQVDKIPSAAQGPELVRLRESASTNLNLYKQERIAVVRAQEVGPQFESFAAEATSANLTFARYARHFAGKDRTTRDAAMLGELVDELKRIEKRMTQLLSEAKSTELERDRRVVRDNLDQYTKEIGLIATAQKAGTDEQQASALATLANAQFAVYQGHFAGEPRISRRPALLMRVVSSLKDLHKRMTAFQKSGLDLEFNTKNINVVEDRLKVYEAELGEIRKLRQATAFADIMGELGGAANKLFDAYRKGYADKPRNQVDLDQLGLLCDKLGEIRQQMGEMARAEDNEMNLKNLDVVTEQLVMFEGEYEAVFSSKSQQKTT